MINPIFWLVLSFLLVSMSLTAVLVVLVPAVRELSRAARSVEKLCDTINRELPPTLESIRLTSAEINSLTDDVNEGVQNASRVAQQVDQSMTQVSVQAKRLQIGTRSLIAGLNAALVTFTKPTPKRAQRTSSKSRQAQSRPASLASGSSRRPQSARSPQVPKSRLSGLPANQAAERPPTNSPDGSLPVLPQKTPTDTGFDENG